MTFKFALQCALSIEDGAIPRILRAGKIQFGYENQKSSVKALETPSMLVCSSRGSPPHLTPDMLERLLPKESAKKSPSMLSFGIKINLDELSDIPIFSKEASQNLCINKENISQPVPLNSSDQRPLLTLHSILRLHDYILFMGINPTRTLLHSNDGHITIEAEGGHRKLSTPDFVDYYCRLAPDVAYSSSDPSLYSLIADPQSGSAEVTLSRPSSKRVARMDKALLKTLTSFDALSNAYEMHKETKPFLCLSLPVCLFPLLTQFDKMEYFKGEVERRRSHIGGFVVENMTVPVESEESLYPHPKKKVGKQQIPLTTLAPSVSTLVPEPFLNIAHLLNALPADPLRIYNGHIGSLAQVVEVVELGFDVIDSSCLARWASQGIVQIGLFHSENGASDKPFNLFESKYQADMNPVLSGCQCYACLNHTRSYIHHLLKTHEMLAEVLIFSHNAHHLLRFMGQIRSSILDGTFSSKRNKFMPPS